MTENPVRSLVVLARYSSHFFILLCCATLILEGCSARRRPVIPWATAVMVRPTAQLRSAEENSASEDPLPDLRFELPTVSGRLIGLRPVPPRPQPHRLRIGAALAAWRKKRRCSPRNSPVRSSSRSTFALLHAGQSLLSETFGCGVCPLLVALR